MVYWDLVLKYGIIICFLFIAFGLFFSFVFEKQSELQSAKDNLTYNMGYAQGLSDCNDEWVKQLKLRGILP